MERGVARGPRKIRDSSPVHAGLLYARMAGAGVLDACLDAACALFWRRELDIEDAAASAAADYA